MGVLAVVLAAAGITGDEAHAQDGQPADAPANLSADSHVIDTLPAGAIRTYTLSSDVRVFAHLRLAADGGLVRLDALALDGTVVARRERLGGVRRPIDWRRVIEPGERFTVRVTSLEHGPPDVRVALDVIAWRAPEPVDLAWVDLDGRFEQAERAERAGDGATALISYEAARAAVRGVDDPTMTAWALLGLGGAYADAGRAREAERTLSESRDIARAADDTPGESAALVRLGRLLAASGQPVRARQVLGEALALRERMGDVPGQAEAHVELGGVGTSQSDFPMARAALAAALARARESRDRRSEADALNIRGVISASQGDTELAIGSYRDALALRRTIDDAAGIAQTTNNLGVLYNSLGESRTALTYYEEALGVRRRLGAPQSVANTLHNLGVALANLGQHERALTLWDEALALWQRTSGRRGEAFTLQAMGQSAAKLGEPLRAIALFDRALAAWKDVGDVRGEAQTLLAVAPLQARQRQRDRAIATFDRALTLARSADLKREVGLALLGSATLSRQGGEPDRALDQALEALGLLQAIGERREAGRAWIEIGTVHRGRGRLAESRSALAAGVVELQAVEDRTEEAAAHFQLALTAEEEAQADESVREARAALDLIESARADLSAERLRLSLFASRREYYEGTLALLVRLHRRQPGGGFAARAFEVGERMRARMLLDLIAADAPEAGDSRSPLGRELGLLEELVTAKAARLTRLLSVSTPNAGQAGSARRELDDLLRRLDSVRGRSRRDELGTLARAEVLDWDRTLALSRETDATLIEYVVTEDAGYAWVVSPASNAWFEVPGRRTLEPLVNALHRTMAEPAAAMSALPGAMTSARESSVAARGFDEAARALAAAVLTPVWPAIRSSTRAVIVADGLLQAVPFAALPVPGSSRPLVSHMAVAFWPSASVGGALIDRARSRAAPSRRVAVFADPVFTRADARMGERRATGDDVAAAPPRLHFSGTEARAIASAAPGRARVWSGFEATREQVFSADLASFGIVHFATHAWLDDERPQLSAIELSRVDARGRALDGSVRLLDVPNLALNSRLVVLSGCRTALGRPVVGEGMIGFAREFLNAGATAILASLWDVDDRATAALMSHFYDALLLARASPAAALRTAQTRMRRDPRWQHPADWAGWVLIGVDSPATGATSSGQ